MTVTATAARPNGAPSGVVSAVFGLPPSVGVPPAVTGTRLRLGTTTSPACSAMATT